MKRAVLVAAFLVPGVAALAQTPGIQGVVEALRAQGYSDVEVSAPRNGRITVEAHRPGAERELVYDAQTGRVLSDQSHASGSRDDNRNDGAGHDAGDDNGNDGAGHDAGDDNGSDGAGHDAGDDHGNDGAGHDAGDDNGNDSGGHDAGDDHGNDGTGHDAGDDQGNDGAGHDAGDDHGGGDD